MNIHIIIHFSLQEHTMNLQEQKNEELDRNPSVQSVDLLSRFLRSGFCCWNCSNYFCYFVFEVVEFPDLDSGVEIVRIRFVILPYNLLIIRFFRWVFGSGVENHLIKLNLRLYMKLKVHLIDHQIPNQIHLVNMKFHMLIINGHFVCIH